MSVRVILNLTEQQVRDLNEIAGTNNDTFEDILMLAFYNYIFDPSYKLGNIVLSNRYEEYKRFLGLLTYYFNEAVTDIKDSARSEEAYDTDVAMAKVFERIRDEHILQSMISADLFEVFKEEFKEELR